MSEYLQLLNKYKRVINPSNLEDISSVMCRVNETGTWEQFFQNRLRILPSVELLRIVVKENIFSTVEDKINSYVETKMSIRDCLTQDLDLSNFMRFLVIVDWLLENTHNQ